MGKVTDLHSAFPTHTGISLTHLNGQNTNVAPCTAGFTECKRCSRENDNTCRDTTLTLSKWMCPLGSVTAGFA